jgi:hypothetical protein
MNKSLALLVLLSGSFLSNGFAVQREGFQPATVVSVDNRDSAEVFSYDIGIRLGCAVCRSRYDSAFDSLPSVFTVNRTIEVNVHKRVIEATIPAGHMVRMSIGGRNFLKDQSCAVGSWHSRCRAAA